MKDARQAACEPPPCAITVSLYGRACQRCRWRRHLGGTQSRSVKCDGMQKVNDPHADLERWHRVGEPAAAELELAVATRPKGTNESAGGPEC